MVAVEALACELPHEHKLPLSRLSLSEIRREAVRRGLVASAREYRERARRAVIAVTQPTDQGNADLFQDNIGSQLRCVTDQESWFAYDEGV